MSVPAPDTLPRPPHQTAPPGTLSNKITCFWSRPASPRALRGGINVPETPTILVAATSPSSSSTKWRQLPPGLVGTVGLVPGRSRFVPSRAATGSRAGAEHQRGPVHRHNVPRPDWLRELHRLGEIGVACRYRSALSTLLRATQPTIVQWGKESLQVI